MRSGSCPAPVTTRLVAGLAALAAFPLAWMIESWRAFGSPLGFAKAGSAMNEATNLFYDQSTPLRAALNYPEILLLDHRLWLAAALPGAALALYPRFRGKALPVLLAGLALLAVSIVISIWAGIGSNLRARFSFFLLLPLLPLAAGVPAALEAAALPRRLRAGAFALAGLWLLGIAAVSSSDALRRYPNWFGAPDGIFPVLELVNRQEDANQREETGLPRLREAGARLCVAERDASLFLLLRAHARSPQRIAGATHPHELIAFAESAEPGDKVLSHPEEGFPPPPGFELAGVFMNRHLFRKPGTPPAP